MKALTIWQPWCSLIIVGAKPYEFRGWKVPRSIIGHRIALHAAARKVRWNEIQDLIDALRGSDSYLQGLRKDIALPLLELWLQQPKELPLGAVLGVATIGSAIPSRDMLAEFGAQPRDIERFFDCNYEPYAWPLSDIRSASPPRTLKGAQGFFNCDFSEAA